MDTKIPFISIILPIRNEKLFIRDAILSIFDQNYKKDRFEIIVADGCSTDGTIQILNELKKTYSNLYVIDNPKKIVSTGFNLSLSIAKGEYIIRVDGHSKLAPGFLQNCIKTAQLTQSDCVGGVIEHISNRISGKVVSAAQTTFFGVGGAAFRQSLNRGKYVDTLAFGMYNREVFTEIGGYDEELIKNQDDEFNLRLIQRGGKIWLDPSICSFYYPRNSLFKLFMQYFYYGFYKVRVMQKRRGYGSIRHFVPFLFVSSLFFSLIFKLIYNSSLLLNVILIPYVFLSILFTLIVVIKYKGARLEMTLLPIFYFVMHFSYGIGFSFGLFFFINKWFKTDCIDGEFDKQRFKQNAL